MKIFSQGKTQTFLTLFLFSICIQSGFTQNNKYDVFWTFEYSDYNKAINDLSYKILQNISKNEIQAIDITSEKIISKEEVHYLIEPFAQKCFLTKEDVIICIKAGDFSVMSDVESKYSAEKLQKLDREGKDINTRFSMKAKSSFESSCMRIMVHQKLEKIDTLSSSQKGEIAFIIIYAPKHTSSDKKDNTLFKIKYTDFLKLNLDTEKYFFENNQMKILIDKDDIRIKNTTSNEETILSSLKIKSLDDLGNTIFKYFKNNIQLK